MDEFTPFKEGESWYYQVWARYPGYQAEQVGENVYLTESEARALMKQIEEEPSNADTFEMTGPRVAFLVKVTEMREVVE